MEFNPSKAKDLLEQDRHAYLKKVKEYLDYWLEKEMDDAATQSIITAGQELEKLNGSLLYLEELEEHFDEYPRFRTIFGD